jgi:cytoskeleton protein RodZ
VVESPLTVGETVARARAAAGMTVAQVAETTRIRSALISAIENDDFRPCGGDVYARGHLKSIATAIGIDPTALAAQLDEQLGSAREEAAPVAPVVQPTRLMDGGSGNGLASLAGTLGASLSGGRRGANWSAVMALALVVIVVVGAVSVLGNRPSGSSSVAGPGVGASNTPSPASSSPEPATPSAPPSTTRPPDVVAAADGVLVKLTVTGRASWVRVTTGTGKTLFEGTLSNGVIKTFRDKTKVKLLLGDAGAVALNVNSHDLGAPGSGGQVLKVEFGPGDPTNQPA